MSTTGSETTASAMAAAPTGANADWSGRLLASVRAPAGFGSHVAIGGILAVILAVCMKMGLVPMRSYVDDLLFFADNGWRVFWGQVPHVDYSSGHGPLTFILPALGLKLAGRSVDGLGYSNMISGIVVGLWAYLLLIRRVSGWLAVAGAAMLCLVTLAPVQLGESFRLSTIAMSYNRLGYALLGLMIVEAFPLREDAARGFGGAFSSGAACALLLFLKANYFLVSVVLSVVSLVWTGRFDRRRVLGLAAGFGAVTLAMLVYMRFDFSGMLADLRMAADARGAKIKPAFVLQVFAENFPGFLILTALAAAAQMTRRAPVRGNWLGYALHYRALLLTGMLFAGSVALLVSNCQFERLPIFELLALLFIDCIVQGTLDRRYALALCVIGLGLILGTQSSDPLALVNGLRLKSSRPAEYAYPIVNGGFKGAVFMDDYLETRDSGRPFGRFLARYLQDGTDLLRRELKSGEKVATMDNYNPFPFALGIEPPNGGMACAMYKQMFSDRLHPTADVYFGNADVMMFPKEHELPDDSFQGLLIYYYPEMERRFTLVAESAMWKMYRKKR